MSVRDYDDDIQSLEDFLQLEMTETPEAIVLNEDIIHVFNSKFFLKEKVSLESTDPNLDLFLEVYDEIDSDAETLSNHSESYLDKVSTLQKFKLDPVELQETSLCFLLDYRFVYSNDSDHSTVDASSVVSEKVIKQKRIKTVQEKLLLKKKSHDRYVRCKQIETKEKRLIRLEKRRYASKELRKKKLLTETEEERLIRLKKANDARRKRKSKKLQTETKEERFLRLKKYSDAYQRKLMNKKLPNETDEERFLRLKKYSDAYQQKLKNKKLQIENEVNPFRQIAGCDKRKAETEA